MSDHEVGWERVHLLTEPTRRAVYDAVRASREPPTERTKSLAIGIGEVVLGDLVPHVIKRPRKSGSGKTVGSLSLHPAGVMSLTMTPLRGSLDSSMPGKRTSKHIEPPSIDQRVADRNIRNFQIAVPNGPVL